MVPTPVAPQTAGSAIRQGTALNLTGADAPERLQVEIVSFGYFPLLGVNAIVGRTFTAEEDAGAAVLLGYGLWHRRIELSRLVQ